MVGVSRRRFAVALLLGSCVFGQWQPPVRLTYHDAISTTFLNHAWCIAARSDTVHIVWDEYAEGCWEVYARHSYDGGITWTNSARLSDSMAASQNGHLAVWGEQVHVVWRDEQPGNDEIFYCRSFDAGQTWSPAERLTQDAGISTSPSVAANDSVIHIAWSDDRTGHNEIFYKRSTDQGITWEADIQLSSGTYASLFPSVAVAASRVHIVWTAGWEIYHTRSLDYGLTWEATERLTYDPAVSWLPSVAASDTIVHVLWHDQRAGYIDVFYMRSIDGGSTWLGDTNLTANSANSNIPCLAVAGSMVHIAWYDNRDGNYEIYYKRSSDHGVSWEDDLRLTTDDAVSKAPCCAASGSRVHVVWSDMRDGNWEIYYMQDPTGNAVEDVMIHQGILERSSVQLLPNPFTTFTQIYVGTGYATGNIELRIYDATGRVIKSLYPIPHTPGNSFMWDGTDDTGRALPAGIYFVCLFTGKDVRIKNVVLLR